MWKVFITSFILIGLHNAVLGQNNYMKMIDDGKHAKAEKKLNKAIEKSPDDIELNYSMAYLYISREFNKYNPEQSYEYLTKAYRKFNQVNDEKIIKQLEKIPINKSKFESLLDTVSRCALEDATAINTIVKYERFLSYFELSPKKYKNSAIERRDVVAYAEATKANTVESYQSFMNNYPVAKQFRDAEKNRNTLAFLNAKKQTILMPTSILSINTLMRKKSLKHGTESMNLLINLHRSKTLQNHTKISLTHTLTVFKLMMQTSCIKKDNFLKTPFREIMKVILYSPENFLIIRGSKQQQTAYFKSP